PPATPRHQGSDHLWIFVILFAIIKSSPISHVPLHRHGLAPTPDQGRSRSHWCRVLVRGGEYRDLGSAVLVHRRGKTRHAILAEPRSSQDCNRQSKRPVWPGGDGRDAEHGCLCKGT